MYNYFYPHKVHDSTTTISSTSVSGEEEYADVEVLPVAGENIATSSS